MLYPKSDPYVALSAVSQARKKLGTKRLNLSSIKPNRDGMKNLNIQLGVVFLY